MFVGNKSDRLLGIDPAANIWSVHDGLAGQTIVLIENNQEIGRKTRKNLPVDLKTVLGEVFRVKI